MIKEKFVTLYWNPKNKNFYTDKGYNFTKYKEAFRVDVKDLSNGSHAKVTVLCDGCGKEIITEYRTYLRCRQNHDDKYFCIKCGQKISCEKHYGVLNQFQREVVKEKSKQTMQKRYSVDYNAQRPEIKEKFLNGDKNIFWIDGRNKYAVDRNTSSNKKWRKDILKKFKFQCFVCGCKEKLIAHHILSFEDNKNLALSLDNGVCLCEECHKDFHKKYGYGHNDAKQFYKWLLETLNDYPEKEYIQGEIPCLEAHSSSLTEDEDIV